MLSRRNFLKLGGAGALVVTAGSMSPLFMSKAFAAGQPGATVANGSKALVIVELSGGNDGLNTVVPFGNPAYYQLRPTLGIAANTVLKVNNNIGLHPSLKGLYQLYQAGQVAIVQGVCYPNPNYSHFEATDIWQSARPNNNNSTQSGWIGRYLDNQKNGANLAASVTGDLPITLYSQTTLVPAISDLASFNFQSDNYYSGSDGSDRLQIMRRIYQQVEQNPVAEYVRNSALDALATADVLQRQLTHIQPGTGYPQNSDLSQQLATVVELLESGLEFRVFYTRISGFDTHSNETSTQATLLQDLGDSIAAFYNDLKRVGIANDVVLMTFSEFGRRAEENGSGTDHGSAQPMFIVGNPVKGGVYGAHPSLTDLDDGNLKATTDFRQVYATLLENWLKVPSQSVLDQVWPTIPFL